MGVFGESIRAVLARTRGLGDALLKDVEAADFARKPRGTSGLVDTNHPAFVYGHLSIYPARVLEFLGTDASAVKPTQRYLDLFDHGKPCEDDAGGSIYPPMEEIVARFKAAHDAVAAVIAEVPDEVFARPLPHEGMRARFPTVGAFTLFMLASHTMMHMGQVSAWRRGMGLGSAM